MGFIEFLLNFAGLLLWINWQAQPHDPLRGATPATLVGTLRRTNSVRSRRWQAPAALAALLLGRAEFYHVLGPALEWTGTLDLAATRIAFRSDSRPFMLMYSALSFGWWLVKFWLALLLISLLARTSAPSSLPGQLARAQLGRIVDWPSWVKALLPLLAGAVGWWLASWPLAHGSLISRPATELARLAQAGLVGSGLYLAWKYVLVALLALDWVQGHVYLGRHPLWRFVEELGRRLMRPLRGVPLRVRQVDLRPLLMLALVLGFAHMIEHGVRSPVRLDVNGRPESPAFEVPGLAALFARVSR